MKRSINILCAAAVLFTGLCGCQKKQPEPLESVDLRYRVADSYELPARGAQPFTIVVTSSAPWTVTSAHPDWCIISEEEGAASDPQQVLVGRGDKTSIKVQYYDNTELDDREDEIVIRSGDWVGKRVKILQKGIAYLTVPEDEQDIQVAKAGGDVIFHISSNQNWSVKVTEGDWISVPEGAEGNGDAEVVVKAQENSTEMRYAALAVYDRHQQEIVTVRFTQDGVQLDPQSTEIRAGYDQASTSLAVVANAKWTAVKDNDADDWYTITNPSNEGNATLNIEFTTNEGTNLRVGHIIIRSVSANPDDFVAERIITVKQAYKITPVRKFFDNDEMGSWKSDWANTPVYTKGVGTLFTSQARLNKGDMPFGSYTFRWNNIDPASRVRHWFCYSDGQELKFNIVATSTKLAIEFNTSSAGISGKPSLSSDVVVDLATAHELTIKFDPSGTEYCHVTYLFDGVEVASFDSSDSIMHMVKWGSSINMYVGVDTGGSAVCEWYEYTAPVDWED